MVEHDVTFVNIEIIEWSVALFLAVFPSNINTEFVTRFYGSIGLQFMNDLRKDPRRILAKKSPVDVPAFFTKEKGSGRFFPFYI